MLTQVDPKKFQLEPEPPPKPKPIPRPKVKRETKEQEKRSNQLAGMIQPSSLEEETFRHSNWKVKRALVKIGLAASGVGRSALERFDACGGDCVIEYDKETQKFRARANYCHNRHCEPCARAKANRLAANLRKRLEETPDGRYRFITLTLKHSTTPLPDQVKRLYASFKKLRNEPLWKSSQRGGVTILEVKWNPESREWHPHLHIISEGEFMRVQSLSEAWLKCTGDSHIVDMRSLDSGKDAAHYVAKYVSKGTNDAVWTDPDARTEWICGMKGTRSAATFGTWRGFKLLANSPDSGTWVKVGTLNGIVREAQAGSPWAQSVLAAINDTLKYDPHKHRQRNKREAL